MSTQICHKATEVGLSAKSPKPASLEPCLLMFVDARLLDEGDLHDVSILALDGCEIACVPMERCSKLILALY
eukprot:5130140-Amphidinium_carterae.1